MISHSHTRLVAIPIHQREGNFRPFGPVCETRRGSGWAIMESEFVHIHVSSWHISPLAANRGTERIKRDNLEGQQGCSGMAATKPRRISPWLTDGGHWSRPGVSVLIAHLSWMPLQQHAQSRHIDPAVGLPQSFRFGPPALLVTGLRGFWVSGK